MRPVQATQEKVAALMQAAEAKGGRAAARRGKAASSPGNKPAASTWRVRSAKHPHTARTHDQ